MDKSGSSSTAKNFKFQGMGVCLKERWMTVKRHIA